MLGVWHLRVVRHAGPMLAESLYGASLEQGRAQCAEAASLAPDMLAVRFGCAIALLEADPERATQEAATILDTVVRLPARDAAAQLIQADARRRLDLLRSGAWRTSAKGLGTGTERVELLDDAAAAAPGARPSRHGSRAARSPVGA